MGLPRKVSRQTRGIFPREYSPGLASFFSFFFCFSLRENSPGNIPWGIFPGSIPRGIFLGNIPREYSPGIFLGEYFLGNIAGEHSPGNIPQGIIPREHPRARLKWSVAGQFVKNVRKHKKSLDFAGGIPKRSLQNPQMVLKGSRESKEIPKGPSKKFFKDS